MLLSVLLLACGRAEQMEVSASATGAAPKSVPTTTFQGAVAAIDADAEAIVVAVQIVWAPILEARAHERRVAVGPLTRWGPGQGLAQLRVGDEVQVDAEDVADGAWRAMRVRVLDLD